jgi:hypothetical protein
MNAETPKICSLATIALLNSGAFGTDAKAIAEEIDLLCVCMHDAAEDDVDYLRVSRKGMRVALTRSLRKNIWDIFMGCKAQVDLENRVLWSENK